MFKLVGRGVTGVGLPSVPMVVGSGATETGVDKPSAPVVNDSTAPVEFTDEIVVMILPSDPVAVAIAPAPVAFKLVTRVVGVGKPSGPINVDTEVMVGKIGVGRPS
jgi:hypothetical protein